MTHTFEDPTRPLPLVWPGSDVSTRPLTVATGRKRGSRRPTSRPTPAPDAEAVPASVVRRAITLAAVLGLLVVDSELWGSSTAALGTTGVEERLAPAAIVVMMTAGATLLTAAALAILSRGTRLLAAAEAAVLLAAVAIATAFAAVGTHATDEGVLTAHAATELLHGHAVYGVAWPSLFTNGIPLTTLMSGAADLTYIYPPLTVLLVLAAHVLAGVHWAMAPGVVGAAALILGALVAWALVPQPWRVLTTLLLLGPGPLLSDALGGYPAITALALLIPIVALWPRIAASGRLGARGALAAAGLGLACSAHQLAWFLVPFLLIGALLVAAGHHGVWRAVRLVAGLVGVAAVAWAAANAWLAIRQPEAWARSLTLPFTQNAIVHGQGLVDVTMYLTSGSGAVRDYDLASDALLAAAAVALLFAPRRLALAIPMLPALALFLSSRSPADYLLLFGPLWILALLCTPRGVLERAAHLPFPRGRALRIVGVLALLLPTAVLATTAVTTPEPLDMHVERVVTRHHRAEEVVLSVTNDSASTIRPTFLSRFGTHPDAHWRVRSGPTSIGAGDTATYVLVPTSRTTARQAVDPQLHDRIVAVSSDPLTISSASLG